MMDNQISIVIPVYNSGLYFQACLNSVLSQIDSIFQVILVDDCSSDLATIAALEGIKSHPKFTVIFNAANLGVCRTQNVGVQESKGKYIGFLDCDDILMPGAVQSVLNVIQSGDHDYIFSNRLHIDSKGNLVGHYDAQSIVYDLENAKDGLIDVMFASHFKVIKRSALLRIGGFIAGTEGIQDWDIALKISDFGQFCFIPEFLYGHRLHINQTTTRNQASLFRKTNMVRRLALKRQSLVFDGAITDLELVRIRSLVLRLRFARDHHGQTYRERVEIGLAITWMNDRLCVLPIDALLSGMTLEYTPNWLVLCCSRWHELGALRRVRDIHKIPVVYVVDERSQDSVSMARWYNSYFSALAYTSSLGELAMAEFVSEHLLVI